MSTSESTDTSLNEASITFLNQECERMLSLYSEAQASIQSVFNFYLTFISAVIGGILLVLQSAPQTTGIGPRLLLAGLLFFAAIVGIVYLSAISGRYARAAKYSFAFDEIRRYLIHTQGLQLPELYTGLKKQPRSRTIRRSVNWLFPTGTYQLFIILINGLALSLFTGLIFSIAQADLGRTIFAMALVFGLVLTIFNVYSHLVIAVGFKQSVKLYHWDENQTWAAKE